LKTGESSADQNFAVRLGDDSGNFNVTGRIGIVIVVGADQKRSVFQQAGGI
jgi:hypothetical protein